MMGPASARICKKMFALGLRAPLEGQEGRYTITLSRGEPACSHDAPNITM